MFVVVLGLVVCRLYDRKGSTINETIPPVLQVPMMAHYCLLLIFHPCLAKKGCLDNKPKVPTKTLLKNGTNSTPPAWLAWIIVQVHGTWITVWQEDNSVNYCPVSVFKSQPGSWWITVQTNDSLPISSCLASKGHHEERGQQSQSRNQIVREAFL